MIGRAKQGRTPPGGTEDMAVRLRLAQGSLRLAREELSGRIEAAAAMVEHCRATAEAYGHRSRALQEAMRNGAPSDNAQALQETAERMSRQAGAVQTEADRRLQALLEHRRRLDEALDKLGHSAARLELAEREAAGRDKLRGLGRGGAGLGTMSGGGAGAVLDEELREAQRLAHQAKALAELRQDRL